MDTHTCVFSIMRLQAGYRGNSYKLDECEGCGAMQLATGSEHERRIISPSSAEFEDVLDFFEFLIKRAAQKTPAT